MSIIKRFYSAATTLFIPSFLYAVEPLQAIIWTYPSVLNTEVSSFQVVGIVYTEVSSFQGGWHRGILPCITPFNTTQSWPIFLYFTDYQVHPHMHTSQLNFAIKMCMWFS